MPWWSHLVTVSLIALVLGWLAKTRKGAKVEDRARVLTNPASIWVIGVVCNAFFGLFFVLAALQLKPKDWWVLGVPLVMLVIGSVLIVDGVRVRHELTDGGIAYQGTFVRYDRVLWNELEAAYWNPMLKWLVLTTWDGRKLRFSGMLNGLDALALALAERAPNLRANPATAKVLADARQGILPNIWH